MSAGPLPTRRQAAVTNRKEIPMADFIYLFRGGMAQSSPEQMQQEMQKWRLWIEELGKKGHYKSGDPLDRAGKVVSGKQKVVTDGPYAEAKDLVGGYLMVAAENIAQAADLAKGCPIFDNNGTVEVRPVMKM
jgi:hypothetical protein